ncbi:MAG: heavy-metal-associated domain-containing protein [Pseudonocardiaceae bacterium]
MATTTHVFRVDGMHCGSCALLIDDTLEDLPGVHDTQTTIKAGRATVELDLARSSPEDVIAAIAELGYRANLDDLASSQSTKDG